MSHTIIKRLTVGAAALAGVAALGACGTTNSAAPAPAPSQAQSQQQGNANDIYDTNAKPTTDNKTSTKTGTSGDEKGGVYGHGGGVDAPRCATSDLKLEVGQPVESNQYPGQYELKLTYRNISQGTCSLYGVPGVDLHGPDNANGPVYSLPRIDNGVKYNEVPAGSAASASITFLKGNDGADRWTPNTIVTTPPGQTTQLTAAWPAGYDVLRQDGATHPGTYVNGVLGTVS